MINYSNMIRRMRASQGTPTASQPLQASSQSQGSPIRQLIAQAMTPTTQQSQTAPQMSIGRMPPRAMGY